jgi:hypothetical protein
MSDEPKHVLIGRIERAYLMSNRELTELWINGPGGRENLVAVRDFYESLIAKGELRKVVLVKRAEFDNHLRNCSKDAWDVVDDWHSVTFSHCPGCGNPITE